jgi:hypothetical protein
MDDGIDNAACSYRTSSTPCTYGNGYATASPFPSDEAPEPNNDHLEALAFMSSCVIFARAMAMSSFSLLVGVSVVLVRGTRQGWEAGMRNKIQDCIWS